MNEAGSSRALRVLGSLLLGSMLWLSAPALAITVTATQNTTALVNALLGSGSTGIIVTGVTLSGFTQESFETPGTFETSSGTYTNPSGTYGIGAGVVLSTGAVERYGDGANTADDTSGVYFDLVNYGFAEATPAQEALLDPITTVGAETFEHFDVTELLVTFDMQPGQGYVRFNVVFGSEEYPEFTEVGYFDGFGMFLNGTNVAFVASQPVNITHPDMAAIAGTELNGVLAPGGNPLLVFGGPVNPTGNTLRFIIGDRDDSAWDSTVYISGLTAPEPGSSAALAAALGALGVLFRARRRR
ncbi:MAG: choice-of-anchor L domain-containing protein [Deltaproteobacteria bacterium]|nr:choice-of-anchor L domain-containing protein [Deltaproteobacteria bacterium]